MHHLDVPYEHVETEGAFPLERWLSDHRRAYRAGTMAGERAAELEELEELGIVWDTADAAFEQNLAAARAYYELHGTLAAPRGATILGIAIGQYLTNIRRPGRLGKDPGRAQRRAAALAAIDPDCNPRELGWTVDRQRHYAYLAQLVAEGARLTAVVPGVTRHGEDIGRWLTTQRRNWEQLNEEQQRRLATLGAKKARRDQLDASQLDALAELGELGADWAAGWPPNRPPPAGRQGPSTSPGSTEARETSPTPDADHPRRRAIGIRCTPEE
ncbi:helicase associated domain-containing protein [Streptomyces sp. NPDC056402]|uniref:helicase associated domain-containing protein n=1 Tax=Streptomyces sp. NPDC056402 TaxID=3345810 RepID=UPI0035E315EC